MNVVTAFERYLVTKYLFLLFDIGVGNLRVDVQGYLPRSYPWYEKKYLRGFPYLVVIMNIHEVDVRWFPHLRINVSKSLILLENVLFRYIHLLIIIYIHQNHLDSFGSGSHNVTFRPAEAIRQCLGENLVNVTFYIWDVSFAISTPLVFHTCTIPF